MNRWEKKLNDHEILTTLGMLSDLVSKEFDDLDSGEVTEKRRFFKMISLIENHVKSIDPELVSFKKVDALNVALKNANIKNQATAYTNNGNVDNLVAANDLVEDVLELLPTSSMVMATPKEEGLSTLEKLIDSTSTTLISKKDKLTTELNDLEKTIEKNSDSYEIKTKETENKLDGLSKQIEQHKIEVNSQISDWQSQFSNSQETRSTDFSQWKDSFVKDNSTTMQVVFSDLEKSVNQDTKSFTEKMNDILKDGNEKHRAILELYELTAGDSVGAGYVQNAGAEKKQADVWRGISVGFIVVTVFWLLFSYKNTSTQGEYNVQEMLPAALSQTIPENAADTADTKIKKSGVEKAIYNVTLSNDSTGLPWVKIFLTFSISGVLLWGSAYAAQQSTIHRNNEKRTRRFALEVKAFDPFISSLDLEQRNELKKQFSNKIFGQETVEQMDSPKVSDEHALKSVVDVVETLASKIPKVD